MKTKLAVLLVLLVTHFFTAAWAAEVVIPDAALKSAIWYSLGKPEPVGILTEQDMLSVTQLYACCRGVKSLEGLGVALNLTRLDLAYNQLTNLTLPAGLTSLAHLDLSYNQLTSLTFAGGLTNLTTLTLFYSTSTNFTLRGDVSHLTEIRVSGQMVPGPIANPAPLMNLTLSAGLANLRTLDVVFTRLTSLTLAADATSLTSLRLGFNRLTSLTLPAGLTNLTTLDLSGNGLTSMVELPAGLTSLTYLNLDYNPLRSLTLPAGITNLTMLLLRENPLERVVLPEPLSDGRLQICLEQCWTIGELPAQGVSVLIYLPGLYLTALPRTESENFVYLLTGPPGWYDIEVTKDFSTWTYIDTVTIDENGSVKVTDPSATARPRSFYRAARGN